MIVSLCLCSAVRPKAGGAATAGAWTSTGSLCPAMTAGIGRKHSATTRRANERTTSGQREEDGGEGGGEEGQNKKKGEKRAYFAHACHFMSTFEGALDLSGPISLGEGGTVGVNQVRGEGSCPSQRSVLRTSILSVKQ